METAWSGAGPLPQDPDWAGGQVFVDRRETTVDAPAGTVHAAVCRIGGGQGYYAADWLWRIRGWMDRIIGGPGLRRGRRNPETVAFGEALDFWRVTGIEPGRRLELRAEMKLPGEASLEFDIRPDEADGRRALLIQTARFKPKGLRSSMVLSALRKKYGGNLNLLFAYNGLKRSLRSGLKKRCEGRGSV